MMAPGYGHHPSIPSHPMQPHAQGAMPSPDPRPSSGQHQLAQTMPLAGPRPEHHHEYMGAARPDQHPLGMHGQQPGNAPPQQAPLPQQQPQPHQQPQYPHAPPQQQQQHPMLQPAPHLAVQTQGPAFAQAQHGSRMGESASMVPASVAGVPKKNNTVLFVAIGMGSLALIGIVLAAIVLLGGKSDGGGKGASSATASASIPIASAPPPPPPVPPPVVDPVPTAEVTADAGETAQTDDAPDAGGAAEAPTATATATAPTATEVAPPPVPVPVVVKDAGPPPDPNAFNETAARSRLGQANGVLVFCKKEGGVTGPGSATVTFATDGSVSAVSMDPPYAGTPAGDCVTGHFKRTKVSPFQGSPQTLKHSFEVPK